MKEYHYTTYCSTAILLSEENCSCLLFTVPQLNANSFFNYKQVNWCCFGSCKEQSEVKVSAFWFPSFNFKQLT